MKGYIRWGRSYRYWAAAALLLLLLIVTPSVLAVGTLAGSASITGEPLVGGSITVSIAVTNDPVPAPGTYFNDRLYNVTGIIVLPAGITLGSCSLPPSSVAPGPGLGETTITFDNIKNLEVNESINLSCTAQLSPTIDIGTPFTIDYRWEANTLPDESGTWAYFPGPSAADYASITAQPQAFDLEKSSNPNTGEVQVNGAGAYAAGAGGVGVNWPYDYTLTLVNNPLNPSTGIQVVDIIPPGVAYLGNDAVVCSGGGAPASPTPARTLLPDGSIRLQWDLNPLVPGETCVFGYDTAIPYAYRTFADGIIVGGGPFSGGIIPTDVIHTNTYEATGIYQHPVNGPTPSADGTTSTPDDDPPATVTSGYHSIAKSASSSSVLQDQIINYTINGWISEYYDFTASSGTPYVIVDVLPDGIDYCGTGPGVGANGFYGDCAAVAAPLFNGVPLTPVSVVQDANFNLVITWHVTDPTQVQAGDTWTLSYSAQVRDYYAADPTEPVSGLDVRPNNATATGVWNDRITPGRTGTDSTHASASVSLSAPALDKQVFDPVSNTFVDGPITAEIGQRLTYRVRISFDEDLDMRNVIVDDFLPRGQRYVPNTADFTGSQDYPGAPQPAPGVGYTGTTYTAEQATSAGGFFIDACPSPGRYPGSSDPFYTAQQFLGGLQDLIWRLCRVDNSDSGAQILWQVTLDAVVVDDPALFDGYRVANFGNLSGTNSFGTTYSLRDNLNVTYVVPNLVLTKTNNAPNPLDVLAGAFSYTLTIANIQNGAAYDWTIRDAIPAGIRIPGGSVCTGFSTTAPGAFTCTADAGAQAGTGGFVTIRPNDGAGGHDPARPFPALASYSFSFNAELAPGATPDETLTNTASVEYCTRPVAEDLNADGQPDRRCIGYLDPDPLVFDAADTPHSDEGTPPSLADFFAYTDTDTPESNGTDNSNVRIVAVDTDKRHTQPLHVAPQVTVGDFATIGEVYQVTLEITVPGRTRLFADPAAGYVEIVDVIAQEGAVFCDLASGLTGCADPVIGQPGALVTPDTVQSPTAPAWWQANNLSPAVGSTVRFFLEEINNSASDADYTFTITFTMVVTGTNDGGAPVFFLPAAGDQVTNQFTVRYFNDSAPTPQQFVTPPEADQIAIDQPRIRANKEVVRIVRGAADRCVTAAACDGVSVQGGDTIYYQSVFTSVGETTAMDVTLIDRIPQYVTYNGDMVCTSTISVGGGVLSTAPLPAPYSLELQMDAAPAGAWDIPPGGSITCNYSVTVVPAVPAGTQLANFTDADWSTLNGVPGPNDPPERVFDDAPDDGLEDEDIETVPVEVPQMSKTRISPAPTGSPSTAPVRIGDVVDYRITIPLPIGETRNLVVTDALAPGLILYEGGLFSFVTNTTTLTAVQTLNGSNDGIGMFSVDWALSDPACTGTPPCIINDGVNNVAVTITFQAIVADVPLNVSGVVLDNTVSATYRDGFGVLRTVVDTGPFDDEEVVIVEPIVELVKTVSAATADAGDTLTYTVTITNAAASTPSNPDQPTAYDVTWEDDLDPRVQYQAGSMACTLNGVPTTVVVTGTDPIQVTNNVDENLNIWDLRPDGVDELVCTYTVLVLQSVPPGDLLDNTADADWSSLDGDISGTPIQPNERDYDDAPDDGSQDTNTVQVVVPNLTVDKIVGPAGDPNYQADNQYQPGQLIPYQITITLPEGTARQLTIVDTFSTNLMFEAGSTTLSSVPPGVSLASGPTVVGNTVTWVLNDIVYTGTPATANPPTTGYVITLSYQLRVRNTATNGSSYTNTVSVRHDANGDGVINFSDPPPVIDIATVQIETPAVTVTKTENDADNVVDAGDIITYTVTLTNTRPTTGGIAYDVFFTENLDDDTDYVVGSMVCNYDPAPAGGPLTPLTPIEFDAAPFGSADPESAALDTFRVSGGAAENSNPWFLNGGDRIICTYNVVVLDTVRAGDTIVRNSVTATYDTADGDQPQEVTTTTSAVTTTVSVPAPAVAKDVDTTHPTYQADGDYQPGDLVPYVITVTLPEGQTTDLNIIDTLPAGFSYEAASLTVTTSWGPALTPTVTIGAGTVTWAFGTVSVPGTPTGPTASFETITLRFRLRVTAAAPGGTATNTVGGNYDPPGSTNTPLLPDTAVVTVIRPTLSVVKTAAPAQVDAADVVTYTVVITNTSANGATLYDVTFTDNPPDFVTVQVASFVCRINGGAPTNVQITPNVDGADPFTAAEDLDENQNDWDLAPGDALTCVYTAVVDANVPATSTLTNVATAVGSTADGAVADEEDITGNDDAQVTTAAPTLTKALEGADTVFAPGELVTFAVTLRVPEGAALDLRFTDTLPTGLRFEDVLSVTPGYALVGGAPTITAGPGDGSAPTTYLFDFVDPVIVPGVDNTGTLDYADIVVRYRARVTGAAANGASLTNLAAGTYDTGDGVNDAPIGTDSETITVEIPTIDVAKAITRIDPDGSSGLQPYVPGSNLEGGGILEYQVTLTNTHPSAVLYDVSLLENPPDFVSYNAGSMACTLAGAPVAAVVDSGDDGVAPFDENNADPFRVTGALDENANAWDLLPGQSLVCVYTVTVEIAVPAGAVLTNLVTGTGSSADGAAPDEVDVTDTATTTVRVSSPAIEKRVVNPAPPPAPPVVTIGQVITYRIEMTLPAGITTDLVITDTLEGDTANGGIDLAFVPGSTTITRGTADLIALGRVTEAVGVNVDGETTLTWTFQPLNLDPSAADPNDRVELVVIQFQATVANVAANDDLDILNNDVVAVLSPDGGVTTITVIETNTTDDDVRLAVPALEVDKAHDDANGRVDAGQIVTFTITVRNVGSGLAQNLIIYDLLPAGWVYVAGSSQLDAAPLGDPAIAGQSLTWDLNALVATDPTLTGGAALTLSYRAQAPTPVTGAYTNLAAAAGADSLGNPIPADNTDHVADDTDLTDDASVTLTASAAIQGLVWNDLDADGVQDAGENPIPGVTVELYDGAGNLIATTTTSAAPFTYAGVTYPAGSYLFADLPPGNYRVVEVHAGPILYWESTYDADTGTGGTEADRNVIAVNALAAGEIRQNQDFGDRVAGRVQGFVYLDPNGDGGNLIAPGAGDTGIANVTVWLYDSAGNLVATTTTDATGFYQFANLPDGSYTVIVDDADTDITSISPNIAFTPGAGDTVPGRIVDVANGAPVPQAHFPFRVPVALTITKQGFDLNGAPLLPGETIGWLVCALNPDALPAPNVVITDPINVGRLTLVPGSVQAGILAACPGAVPPAGLTSQPDPSGSTITVSYGTVPSGQVAVLYFETTVNDPATWSGMGWWGLLSLLLLGGRKGARRRLLVGLLALAVVLSLLSAAPALSQDSDPTATVEGADSAPTAEPPTLEPTLEPTPTTTPTEPPPTETPTPLVEPSPTAVETPTVEPSPTDTETPAAEPSATPAPESSATPEVTPEPEVTAEPEVTPEPELTPEPLPILGRYTLVGSLYDDADASLTADDGEGGLAGIPVRAYVDDGDQVYTAADVLAAEAVSDRQGRYALEKLATGAYWIVVDEGALPAHYIDVLALGGRAPRSPAYVVVAEAPEAPTETLSMAGLGMIQAAGPDFAYTLDSDGDRTPDAVEGMGDRDGDGLPNAFDPFDPSGLFYLVQTGSLVLNVQTALYADANANCVYDAGVDILADTIQPNPQTSADGGYRYDIRVTNPALPGIPDDGSARCFFLQVNAAPATAVFPSAAVPPQPGALTTGGPVVASALPPVLPVAPATHRFFLTFEIAQGQPEIVNNHVAFDRAAIPVNLSVSNTATASRDGLPPVSDDDTLAVNSSLECRLEPNGAVTLQPGQTYTFNHTLTNTGLQTDTYTLSFVSANPTWTQALTPAAGSTVTLAPGQTQAVSYSITVPLGALNGTTNLTTLTATSSTTPNPDCSAANITTVSAGCVQGVVYNDTNQNSVQDAGEPGLPGVSLSIFDASNVLVATLTTAGDGSYSLAGLPDGVYRIELDPLTLPAGTPLYVNPNVPQQTLTVTAGGTCAVGSFGLVLIDPAITKNGSPTNAAIGDLVTFTITVTNNSTANITGVIVNDPLPAFLDFLSAATTAGTFSFNAGTNVVTFDIGTMTPGQVVTLTVQTRVNASAPTPGTITNTATLSLDQGASQSASAAVAVPAPPPPPPPSAPSGGAPTPTPAAVALGPAGTTLLGVGVSMAIPAAYPDQLPVTGIPPANRLATMAVVALGVWAAAAFGLALVVGLAFRRQLRARRRDALFLMATAALIVSLTSLAGLLTLAGLWLADVPAAPVDADSPAVVAAPPTPVPVIDPAALPSVKAPGLALPARALPAGDAPVTLVRSSQISLASWGGQFTPPEIPATRLVIPALDIDTTLTEAPIVDNRWDVSGFANEIAHLEGTAYLGTTGNAVVAGHVTHADGWGPFRYLGRLKPGDLILAYGDGVEYRYVVRFVRYAEPEAVEYTLPTAGHVLTLVTCAGWDTARQTYSQRLVVRAERVS